MIFQAGRGQLRDLDIPEHPIHVPRNEQRERFHKIYSHHFDENPLKRTFQLGVRQEVVQWGAP